MNEMLIIVPSGKSKKLKTGGKYCPSDIVVQAEEGGAGKSLIATMHIPENQSITVEITNYANNVTMEGESV